MFLAVIFWLLPVALAAVTAGPLAPVSIRSHLAYSTAKPCAAACLAYNGCGCGPINACWCSAGIQSAATSYISSCVKNGCGTVPGVEQDVTSMVGLYGDYCATANVEISSTAAESKITPPPSPISSAKAVSSARAVPTAGVPTSGATAAAGEAPDSTTTSKSEEKKEDEGLSKSDIIALATGLGVGLPSLLIGALALWFQVRKRRAASPATEQKLQSFTPDSQTHFVPGPVPHATPPPLHGYPNVYELGNRGMMGQNWPQGGR